MTTDSEPNNEELGESVVDEVRAIREKIDAEVGHDIGRLAELVNRRGEEICREYGLTRAEMPPANFRA
ncbi:MAG: hypothetical protein HOP29_16225 [Phycisphaerales bacterium]|nr:hypothetical protein [Phycisphaerales bacterium]